MIPIIIVSGVHEWMTEGAICGSRAIRILVVHKVSGKSWGNIMNLEAGVEIIFLEVPEKMSDCVPTLSENWFPSRTFYIMPGFHYG